jgi:glutathione S-transferase
MRLYDHPASSNALKVRFLLAELGLAYEREEVPMARPRPDSYVALNQFTGIPVLDDHGFVLTESNAILRYLAQREGRDDLFPAEPRAQARVTELMDRFALTVRPAMFKHEAAALGFKFGTGFGAVPGDPERAREIAGQIAPQLTMLEQVLSDGPHALGPFTVADCALAPVLFRTTKSGLDLAPYPKLRALRDVLLARPAFQAAGPVT